MFTIAAKRTLAGNLKQMDIVAPDIAKRAKPGQFVVLRVHERGERIPLTIADTDSEKGTVRIIFQEAGKTTCALGLLNEGEALPDMVGPLGHPTTIEKAGTVVAIAGGVGVAEILPVVKAYRAAENKVIAITGARNKDLLILTAEINAAADKLFIVTDDGSAGQKGFVTNVLEDLLAKQVHIDLVYAIGPVPMMKAVAGITREWKIKTVVSLNPIMVDGTGMCGACRVSVGGETKFACVDGPEFDAHKVDFEVLAQRNSMYREQERCALSAFEETLRAASQEAAR
jgi:ferredoxin--NADP+ reductase